MPYTEPVIDDLRFAEDDVVDPVSGQNNAVEPSAGKKDNGFTRSESPPRQDFNWLMRMVWQFCRWAHDELMHPGDAGQTSMLGNVAGRDQGDDINGGIGGLGEVELTSTTFRAQINVASTCGASGDASQVNASAGAEAQADCSQVNAAKNTSTGRIWTLANPPGECGHITSVKNIGTGYVYVEGLAAAIECSSIEANGNVTASGKAAKIESAVKTNTGVITASGAGSQINSVGGGTTPTGDIIASGNLSQINAAEISGAYDITVSGKGSQINAARTNAGDMLVSGDFSQINCGDAGDVISADLAQINASAGHNTLDGDGGQINAGWECTINATKIQSQINSAIGCIIDTAYAIISASKYVKSGITYGLCGGYAASGPASSANRKWEIDSQTGAFRSVLAAGSSFVSSYTFADFGEYFENLKPGVIPLGTIVALEGDKIRPAKEGDVILGTVSATTAFVGANSDFQWQGRFLKGEFGEPLYHEIPNPDFRGEGPAPLIRVQQENPDYDPSRENIPRSDRPEEYSCVALLGQVHVRVGKNVQVGNYIGVNGGKSFGNEPTRLLCMTIKQEFDKSKGYAVALCLLR